MILSRNREFESWIGPALVDNNKLLNIMSAMLQSEFEKRARAMADGDEEPLTENEKHALRNSTVTDDGRHVCGKTRTQTDQSKFLKN